MGAKPEFAEGSTLIRVPASVRDTLAGLRRQTTYSWGGVGPKETLGQVVARLATVKELPKVKARRGRAVSNKRRRPAGRRHR